MQMNRKFEIIHFSFMLINNKADLFRGFFKPGGEKDYKIVL